MADALTFTARCELPAFMTDGGLNLVGAFAGAPDTEKLITPGEPEPPAVTV